MKILRNLIRSWKIRLLYKWAAEFNLYPVEIVRADGVEYLRMADGSLRRLANPAQKGKRK